MHVCVHVCEWLAETEELMDTMNEGGQRRLLLLTENLQIQKQDWSPGNRWVRWAEPGQASWGLSLLRLKSPPSTTLQEASGGHMTDRTGSQRSEVKLTCGFTNSLSNTPS